MREDMKGFIIHLYREVAKYGTTIDTIAQWRNVGQLWAWSPIGWHPFGPPPAGL